MQLLWDDEIVRYSGETRRDGDKEPYHNNCYFDALYGSTKGNIQQGTNMYDARRGPSTNTHYTDERIQQEPIATGDGVTAGGAGNLAYTPVRAGTVVITDGNQRITDDGNGNLVGDIAAGVNTVNYASGAYNCTFAAAPANGAAVVADYEYKCAPCQRKLAA